MVPEIVSNAMSSKEVAPRIIVMAVEVENQGNVGLDVGYSVCLVRRFRGGGIVEKDEEKANRREEAEF